jgi:hypothetical protein
MVQIVTSPDEQCTDFGLLTERYREQLDRHRLNSLACSLGVSAESFRRLRMGWDGEGFTFPMSNDFGKIVGIRRRFPNGRKVSAAGSRTGLFIPTGLENTGTLLITEGPTDCAVALDLGFAAIGRPNCNSKMEMTVKGARGWSEIVIIGDNDLPGRNGAEKLADSLVLYCRSVKIVYPPDGIKDLRQWLQAGLTHGQLQVVINTAESVRLTIHFESTCNSMEANKCRKQA